MYRLPQTGTAALLATLSPHLDNQFIDDLFPRRRGSGRRRAFAPHQLLRVLLLALLTPTHSFNLLVKLLSENRAWRNFAGLPNKQALPGVRMLHEFRAALDVARLRALNRHLLSDLLRGLDPARKAIAIMDSTSLTSQATAAGAPLGLRKSKSAETPYFQQKLLFISEHPLKELYQSHSCHSPNSIS